MRPFALGSSLTSPCIVLHPLPHDTFPAFSLPKDHLTGAKEKTVWSSDEWPSHAPHLSHCWAKGKSAFLPIRTALSATARTQDMTAATVLTHALADTAGALTIAITNVLPLTSPAPPPNASSPFTISMWALSAPPPSLLEMTRMSLALLLEITTEILRVMSLIESRGSASLEGASCYDPRTCRAPIFISLAPSFLINPSRSLSF